MRDMHLEAKVLEIADLVRSGQHVEDHFIELNADWPLEPNRAARRIAGHANASRGQPALWIVRA